MSAFEIAGRPVGPGSPCFLIAEIAQAHDGSLGQAHAYIDAIANAGADAVKFQTHLAAAESTPGEPWRVKFSRQDDTRYDYWRRMEFTEPQWADLRAHCEERGLTFLSSPFSPEAVELLERVGCPAWKVASGEVGNTPLLEQMAATGKPLLISSGMSPLTELDRAVGVGREAGVPVALFQCSSRYPCPPEKTGLNQLAVLRERYSCPVGLSDHSATIYAGIAAVALGASLLEVHVTMSREMFGPDVIASVTTAELAELARGVRFVEAAVGSPLDKDAEAAELAPLRDLFTKSLVTRHDLVAGATLARADLAFKKPGTGIPAASVEAYVGRTLARDVSADTLLGPEDFA